MNFATPTTKAEMYSTLGRIFHYYRIRYDDYEEADTDEIVFSRMNFTPKTDAQLTAMATALLAGAQARELFNAKKELSEKLEEVSAEKSALAGKGEALIEKAEAAYAEAIKNAGYVSEKTGTENSDFYAKKLFDIEKAKAKQISDINASIASEYEKLTAKETALTQKILSLEDEYAPIWQKDVAAKVIELKEAEDEVSRIALRYNNTINEKAVKYINYVSEMKAKLKIEYLKIRQVSFGKDDLVNMGYYEDVISCVTGYYDTLSATAAYDDMKSEGNLIPYLEDYYKTILFLYQTRANA